MRNRRDPLDDARFCRRLRPLAAADGKAGRPFLSFARCRLFQFGSSFRGGWSRPGIDSGAGFCGPYRRYRKGPGPGARRCGKRSFPLLPGQAETRASHVKARTSDCDRLFSDDDGQSASVFYPASTIFETGSTYINQEGRAQFAQRVHHGGVPIWGGEHPPRVYRDFVPGGDHLPAWKALWEMRRHKPQHARYHRDSELSISPGEFIPAEHVCL